MLVYFPNSPNSSHRLAVCLTHDRDSLHLLLEITLGMVSPKQTIGDGREANTELVERQCTISRHLRQYTIADKCPLDARRHRFEFREAD